MEAQGTGDRGGYDSIAQQGEAKRRPRALGYKMLAALEATEL